MRMTQKKQQISYIRCTRRARAFSAQNVMQVINYTSSIVLII